jgi:hypothetical protein
MSKEGELRGSGERFGLDGEKGTKKGREGEGTQCLRVNLRWSEVKME